MVSTGDIRTFRHCCWEYKMVPLLGKIVWQFLQWLNLELAHNPAILLLILPPKFKMYVHTTCTEMFRALFVVGDNGNNPYIP
jgi:hypothetical protein